MVRAKYTVDCGKKRVNRFKNSIESERERERGGLTKREKIKHRKNILQKEGERTFYKERG